MLPNHAPLVVAEQFGTLAALFPGRIDLGLGRAPGTDGATARALRRDLSIGGDRFPDELRELRAYLAPARPGQQIHAVPGTGMAAELPIWLLGSSLFSAELAAAEGLPYAFASHFAPGDMMWALYLYHTMFRASAELERPYVMVAANVLVADSDAEARRQFSSQQQAFTWHQQRGISGPVPPPIDDIDTFWTEAEKAVVSRTLTYSFVGSPDIVARGLRAFLDATRADELMVTAHIHSQAARVRSLELLTAIRNVL